MSFLDQNQMFLGPKNCFKPFFVCFENGKKCHSGGGGPTTNEKSYELFPIFFGAIPQAILILTFSMIYFDTFHMTIFFNQNFNICF